MRLFNAIVLAGFFVGVGMDRHGHSPAGARQRRDLATRRRRP